MERIYSGVADKVMSAEQAVKFIRDGMTLGMSGFTLFGYPKAIPKALAQSGHARHLTLMTGASTGDGLDGVLARAGMLDRRYPYQSNKDIRAGVNAGHIAYSDMHLSMLPTFLRQHSGARAKVDVAVIECVAVDENGLYPSASAGCSDAFVVSADQVIVEINQSLPVGIAGMHDFFEIGVPPHARPIPICATADRVGTPYIPCPAEKIAAIVYTEGIDAPASMTQPDDVAKRIGANIVEFLRSEVSAGRLPQSLGPFQSGVGAVANAVLASLADSGFQGLTMYTETMQDSALSLVEQGIFTAASTCSFSLSTEAQKKLYDDINFYKERIVLRPQELSNHPEVVRRLGLISMNTPIEVDIYGNINSTHIMGSSIMNGIGGSGDFARNARLNIFATESIAKGGAISCIVPMVSHVDHTEHDTQVIVTEQGFADLRFCDPGERAELLIENCAHPDYRPMLWDYLARAKRDSKGLHTPHILTEALSWHQRYLTTGTMRKEGEQ